MNALLAALAVGSLLAPAPARRDDVLRVRGRVNDLRGSAVRGATVELSARDAAMRTETDADGAFGFEWAGPRDVTVVVEARGFSTERDEVRLEPGAPLTVVLAPAAFSDKVTVTASRRTESLGDTPRSVSVVTGAELATSGGTTLDDALRQTPGFTLFRRTSSRSANPTTQGASLRGLGASGASRAAVLEDGVPLNDPFGGWVYWGRVPRVAVDRAEVLRGGASDLYGSGALGGVVNVLRPPAETPRLDGEFALGAQAIGEGSLYAGGRRGGWGLATAAEVYSTSGYKPVPEALRGEVDGRLSLRHDGADLTLERLVGAGRVFVRGGGYRESRTNGTRLQQNDTEIDQGVAGADGHALGGAFRLRADLERQTYTQSFSAVAADRDSERLTVDQRVPARSSGLSGQWTWALGGHVLVAGAERRAVRGTSDEVLYGGPAAERASAGGRQAATGLFVEDAWSPWRRLTLTGAVRHDRWRNFDASATTAGATRPFPDRTERATSPRAGVLLRLSDAVALTGSAYRAFRAPTLNELYRSFRVGDVLTRANESLRAERLSGQEAGALLRLGAPVSVRLTAFSMDVDQPVANVTLESAPGLITRQRQNLGHVRSRGLEVEGEARLGARFTASASWTRLRARIRSSPAEPALAGKRVPQVPERQASLSLRYARERGFAWGIQARAVGSQFDDDLNRLPLRSFTVLDALLSHPIGPWMEWFVAGENLRNERYEVGRTPLLTVGPPRTIRGGLRVRLRAAK